MIERVQLGNVTALVGSRGGKYPSANSVLVEDERTLLVDPSVDIVDVGAAIASRPVDVVVISHAHEDHFAANYLFEEAELIVHEQDAPAMSSLDALMDAYGIDSEGESAWRQIVVDQFNYRERADVQAVRDGETIELGRTTVRCLHTPGHTAGHMCLLFEPDGVVFTGDLDLTRFGPYYADATSSLEDTIRSLERLRDLEGVSAFVSSHEAGVVRDDLRGHVERYLDVLAVREGTLLEFVREPHTFEEIAERCIVYGKRYEHIPWQLHAEDVMMRHHVERLRQQGRVSVADEHVVAT